MIRKAVLMLMLLAVASSAPAATTWNAWSGLDVASDPRPSNDRLPIGAPASIAWGSDPRPSNDRLPIGAPIAWGSDPRPSNDRLPIGAPAPIAWGSDPRPSNDRFPIARGEDPSTTAVPEPGTLTLLALGMLGAGMRYRRRRREPNRPDHIG